MKQIMMRDRDGKLWRRVGWGKRGDLPPRWMPVEERERKRDGRGKLLPADKLDYVTLDALRGEDDGEGPLDHPCPLCGPDRSTEYNQRRGVLRTWKPNGFGFITYKCARCEASGYAHYDPTRMFEAASLPPMPRAIKPPASVDLRFVERLWAEANPILPPEVTAYFRRERGLTLKGVPKGVLRFHPRCPWEGKRRPCIVARFSDAVTGEPKGIWRRLMVPPKTLGPKPKTLGPMGGCVIRLFPAGGKRLVIAEGIETALTAATRFTDSRGELLRPVWATGCAGNMQRLPVLDGIEQLIIIADNDESGTGQAAAAECARRWLAAGRKVECRMPPELGTDLNDLVRP